MPKQTPGAQILLADGEGGMRALEDHRFDECDWPIFFVVPPSDATAWMAHLHAECESRNWGTGGLSQLEPAQNSGSLTLRDPKFVDAAALEIAWEKSRDEKLVVYVRAGALSEDEAREFLSAVSARLKNHTTVRQHRRAWLSFDVLPWRGELWLGRDLRLGPPSQYPDSLFGPQIVVVDAIVEGIGWQGVAAQFQRTLFELRVFLSAVLGGGFDEVKWTRGWAYGVNERGQITDCSLTTLGYAETKGSPDFPAPGSAPPIERRVIERPGLGKLGVTIGITGDMTERWVPDDIETLWDRFCKLPTHKRDQFIKAGNAYLIALTMWPDQPTAYLISDMSQCACGVAHQVSYLGSKMRSPKTEVIHGDKQRYLGELQYRFNRRFDLKRILPRLLVAAVLTPAKPRRILAEGLTETCH